MLSVAGRRSNTAGAPGSTPGQPFAGHSAKDLPYVGTGLEADGFRHTRGAVAAGRSPPRAGITISELRPSVLMISSEDAGLERATQPPAALTTSVLPDYQFVTGIARHTNHSGCGTARGRDVRLG